MARLLAELDRNVAEYGWQGGAQRFLTHFVQRAQVSGAESLPREGPLLVVSNHPAAYDVIILAASLPRDDLKIISSPVSVANCLPALRPHFIFISEDTHERMGTVRAALRHLREGGALLIFRAATPSRTRRSRPGRWRAWSTGTPASTCSYTKPRRPRR